MSDILVPFQQEGVLAVPMLQPIHGNAASCAFRIAAMQEEVLVNEITPRHRSSIAAAFAVWHAIHDVVAEADPDDAAGNYDALMDEALKQSTNDLEELQPMLDKTEQKVRKLWPYEFWLCDQVVAENAKLAMFACFPLMASFPDLAPANPVGVSRSIANVPSIVAHIHIDDSSPNQVPVHMMMGVLTQGPPMPPPLALIPGGAGNLLFDHVYVQFGRRSEGASGTNAG